MEGVKPGADRVLCTPISIQAIFMLWAKLGVANMTANIV